MNWYDPDHQSNGATLGDNIGHQETKGVMNVINLAGVQCVEPEQLRKMRSANSSMEAQCMEAICIQYGKELPHGLHDNDGATFNFRDLIFHDVAELVRVIIPQQLQVYGVTSLSVVHCTEPR